MAREELDSFRLLLNKISHHLTEENVDSLSYICNVPESELCGKVTGIKIFRYLMYTNRISKENLASFRQILTNMRLKRDDILEIVDNYAKKESIHCEIIRSFGASQETALLPPEPGRQNRPLFSIQYSECHCSCGEVPLCCYVVPVVFLLAAVLTVSVFWFGESSRDQDTGKVVLAILSLVLAVIVLYLAYRVYPRCCKRYDIIAERSTGIVNMATSDVTFPSSDNNNITSPV